MLACNDLAFASDNGERFCHLDLLLVDSTKNSHCNLARMDDSRCELARCGLRDSSCAPGAFKAQRRKIDGRVRYQTA